MRKVRFLTFFFASLSVVCAFIACATVDRGERAVANVLLPPSDEVALGKQMKAEINKQLKMHDDAAVQRYIDDMGSRMAKRVKSPVPLKFHVVDDDKQINAFAIPGGDIYVFTGLLKLADDDSEVACVLGHEISHVTQRHIAKQLVQQMGLSTVLNLALGKDPGKVEQIVAVAVAQGTLLKFSRDDERDADDVGLPLCSKAGYDPQGFVRMFQKIRKLGESSKVMAWLQSHPLPSERISDAKESIAELNNKGDDKNAADYRAFKAKL